MCWQFKIRQEKLAEDLKRSPGLAAILPSLRVSDFTFQFIGAGEIQTKAEIKKFISEYEWLGSMPKRISHRFVARYKGHLAGALLFTVPNNFSKFKIEGDLERLLARGACASWTPKNLPSAFISWALRWMAKNSKYRIFTAYADPEANELGTIYQACNFKYMGSKFGARKLYMDPGCPQAGWFSPRRFTTLNSLKGAAKAMSIPWGISWSTATHIHWDRIPKPYVTALRLYLKQWQDRCIARKVYLKHKYVRVMGKDRREQKRLNTLVSIPSFPYPKHRGFNETGK